MKKRCLLSMLLIMCMVVSMWAPAVGSAEGIAVTDLEISGIKTPVAGETASTEELTVAEELPYTIEASRWYTWGDEGEETFTGEFIGGEMYYLEIELAAEDGYEFDYENIRLYLDIEDYDGWSFSESKLVLDFYVHGEMIEEILVTGVPESVEIGQTVDLSAIKVPEGAGYTVEAVWYVWNAEEDCYEPCEEAVQTERSICWICNSMC